MMRITREQCIATVDGMGSGKIPSGTGFVVVESSDADYIITLPNPLLGRTVALRNGATAYELRTRNPETIAINGGFGTDAESAIPADTLTVCFCDTVTTWICSNTNTAGASVPTEVAAP